MSIRKAEISDFFKIYAGRFGSFPLSAKWGARFVLRGSRDFAADLLHFAARFDNLPCREILYRRLAVHEAVLNALRCGGPDPVLTAWGAKKFMQVGIQQKNDIFWPAETGGHRGTALIKRYASEYGISDDKKTLVLRFY